jgi:tetratricopeptide (TPR) repeat protein
LTDASFVWAPCLAYTQTVLDILFFFLVFSWLFRFFFDSCSPSLFILLFFHFPGVKTNPFRVRFFSSFFIATMASWSVLVTIHNLVNIPLSACENGPRTFAVEAHMLHRASAYSAPVAAAIFTTDDVVSTTPNLFEVRLDEVAENNVVNGGGPKVWRCALPEMEAVVMVKEIVGGYTKPYRPRAHEDDDGTFTVDGTRVVGSSAPVAVNVKQVVEVEKLATRVVGTEMGQVGLSFAVDPDDRIGYRRRLEDFLRAHNPQGLRLVPNVVEVVSELDTFTKLYRRYKTRNYEKRLAAFFDVYGAQFKREIPSLLHQWEGREEELMRNLILDNGPELTTVEPHQRLTAYLTAHQLDRKDPDVQAILAEHADAPDTSGLFAAFVERYGPEPDPRTYLFVTPRYTPAAARLGGSAGLSAGPSASSKEIRQDTGSRSPSSLNVSPRRTRGTGGAVPRRSPPTPAGDHYQPQPQHHQLLSVPMSPTPKAAEEAPVETARMLSKSPNFGVDGSVDDRETNGAALHNAHRRSKEAPAITPKDQFIMSDKGVTVEVAARRGEQSRAARQRGTSLWHKMCSMMQTRQREAAPWREYQLFFMHQDEFAAAVRALHVFSDGEDSVDDEVQALVEEWQRRVGSAMRKEVLSPNDAYYGAAVQEAATLTHLLPLHLQVISLTSLFHKEQYTGFSAYVEETAKAARTERLALVGDAQKLMEVARYGVHAFVDITGGVRATQQSLTEEQRGSGSGNAHTNSPIIFFREPFAKCPDKITCGILICEVAVGNTYACPASVHTPRDSSSDFLASFDSCSFVDEAKGAALAVYARQQVFPRLLLQCIVDPHLQPCPAHPDKAVEYYVMDTHAFACSRCVVLGAYKGKDVIPVDEAAVLARGGLAEIDRTANALRESMLAYANQLNNEENSMLSAPRRVEAEREIDRLQKEVEERIRTIRRQVQLEDEAQLSRIQADRTEVEATLKAVGRLTSRLESAMHLSTPVGTVNALQHIQQENEVEQLLARVQSRVPTAPLERVLPLDGPASPPSGGATTTTATPAVAGLNESCLAAAVESPRKPRSVSRPPQRSPIPPRASPQTKGVSGSSDLYSQYLAVARGAANSSALTTGAAAVEETPSRIQALSLNKSDAGAPTHRARPVSAASIDASDGERTEGLQSAKEALTKGWSLLRRGDVAGAQRVWTSVCRAHGTNDVMGTKAHAYLAEAIHKDYAAAAQWYARSLQLDPQDRMTAYNYGVLLEALLDQPQEALRMYDRAASLGDSVAAARARELRSAVTTSGSSSRR